jgi:hypothetical protein
LSDVGRRVKAPMTATDWGGESSLEIRTLEKIAHFWPLCVAGLPVGGHENLTFLAPQLKILTSLTFSLSLAAKIFPPGKLFPVWVGKFCFFKVPA